MILIADRRSLAQDIQIARDAGARLVQVCEIAGIDARTLQRWNAHEGLTKGDGRPQAVRPPPSHALSADERAKLLSVANEPRFCAVPPARIVPMLADEGVYLASESTFARVMREHGQTAHRGPAKAPQARRPPTTHIATAARQVWCWDMTYLPATVIGRWFHLYLILDLYSRKIVGWEVHANDSADHAVHLVRRTALAEGIAALSDKPVLHGDNGSTLKATTVLAMLNWLGVKPSYSRPRVSDDNAFYVAAKDMLCEPQNALFTRGDPGLQLAHIFWKIWAKSPEGMSSKTVMPVAARVQPVVRKHRRLPVLWPSFPSPPRRKYSSCLARHVPATLESC